MSYNFKIAFLCMFLCFFNSSFSQGNPQILLPEMMGKKGVGNNDGIFIACDEINDMVLSIPRAKKYKNYNLTTTQCMGPIRMLLHIYIDPKNPGKKFTSILLDSRKSENENLLAEFKNDYANATYGVQNDEGIRIENTKTNFGQFGSILTASTGVAIYRCILKDFYAFSITFEGDPTIYKNVAAVELFFKEYISKIDISKLK